MDRIKLGDIVKVINRNTNGKVAFIGETQFSDGVWFGLQLDEPTGRHDGMIEGKRYYKCPRNHGVFVRANHVEKISQENSNNRVSDAVPSKATLRNYSKSRKKEKHISPFKIRENAHMTNTILDDMCGSAINSSNLKLINKLKLENTAYPQKNIENTHKTEKGNTEENFPRNHKCPKDEELQKIKQEKEELKIRLKNTEDILHDTLEKYTKTIDEKNNLIVELENKKMRIRIQRDHLKLLKMRSCNHFKRIDLPITSCKNTSTQKEGGDQKSHVEGQTLSDEEFDLETTKSLSFIQLAELEEEIRIMREGLIKLTEFLKCHSPAYFVAVLEAAERDKQKTRSKTDSTTRGKQAHNKLTLELERAKATSALKEYYNTLCEMTRFSKKLSDQCVSRSISENYELPRTSKESEAPHNTHISGDGDIHNLFQGDSKQFSEKPSNITLQIKRKPRRYLVNRKSPVKSDSTTELKRFIPNTEKNDFMADISDSASNSSFMKSDFDTLTSVEQSRILSLKASGGGDGVIAPRRKTPKEKMRISTRKLQNDKNKNK